MTIPRVLILLSITVAATSRHLQKRDWVPPRDWARCAVLEQQALNNLTVIREIMQRDGLNTLVTNGTLNLDCSSATLEGNRALGDDVWGMCMSSTDQDVSIFTSVYSHICNNQQAFIQSEACLSSGAPVAARRSCHIDTTDYERRCREEPVCIENSLRGRNGCSKRIASILRRMAALDFSVIMGDDCIYRAF
ncbi:uncharacterized protein LOC124260239 [Haliotis rubra]|uniref:uncharacterized protein LOC124260239 n=1 Tax=Haliotis rubra TaxID=36100 RepID=UPI001EE50248|nr:uncharacterized protein LOC124260239 [Haliotis rubra]XP_046550452.1 uncharacterized protein LOC124260239 [Haliotis rubra]